MIFKKSTGTSLRLILTALVLGMALFNLSPQSAEEKEKPAVTLTENELEQQLIDADLAFAQASYKNGIDGWMSYFTEDAARVDLFGKVARGHQGIRRMDGPLFATTDLQLRWQPEYAGVFASRREGYTKGPYSLVQIQGGVETVLGTGSYLSLWRLEGDKWKVYLDTGAAQPPAPENQTKG